jgi:DNA adenine methylase
MKTFLKWQGNKSKHLKHIIKYIPDEYNKYIEPFIGSGAVFLKLEPNKWIINDLNTDLINIWNTVKDSPDEIIKEFKTFGKKFKKMSNENKKKWCKEITNGIEHQSYDTQRAIDYMLMSFCSYMGFLFVNNKFNFQGLEMNIYIRNTYTFLNYNYYNNILDISDFLNNSSGKIYNKDYKKILSKAKEGDFVFLVHLI